MLIDSIVIVALWIVLRGSGLGSVCQSDILLLYPYHPYFAMDDIEGFEGYDCLLDFLLFSFVEDEEEFDAGIFVVVWFLHHRLNGDIKLAKVMGDGGQNPFFVIDRHTEVVVGGDFIF